MQRLVRVVGVLRCLPELLHQGVDIVTDVIGSGFCILDHRVTVAPALTFDAGLDEATEKPFRLRREALELIGNAATGIGASLWGEQHAQGKPNGASCQCTAHPNPSRVLS